MIKWWGYVHVDGGVHAKRYFGDPVDLQEARESPFVSQVIQPFEASGRDEAMEILWSRVKFK